MSAAGLDHIRFTEIEFGGPCGDRTHDLRSKWQYGQEKTSDLTGLSDIFLFRLREAFQSTHRFTVQRSAVPDRYCARSGLTEPIFFARGQ